MFSQTSDERALEKIHTELKKFFAGKQGSEKTFDEILDIALKNEMYLISVGECEIIDRDIKEREKELAEKREALERQMKKRERAYATMEDL